MRHQKGTKSRKKTETDKGKNESSEKRSMVKKKKEGG